MAQRRTLRFNSYSEVIQEIESLQKNGYSKGGNWSLAQICRHISYYHKGALDGFASKMPWIIRVTMGKFFLNKLLKERTYKEGNQTDPRSVFTPEPDEKQAIEEAITLLKRLEATTTPLHPSGFFGEMTNEQWKTINLDHASHHLGFLHPVKK